MEKDTYTQVSVNSPPRKIAKSESTHHYRQAGERFAIMESLQSPFYSERAFYFVFLKCKLLGGTISIIIWLGALPFGVLGAQLYTMYLRMVSPRIRPNLGSHWSSWSFWMALLTFQCPSRPLLWCVLHSACPHPTWENGIKPSNNIKFNHASSLRSSPILFMPFLPEGGQSFFLHYTAQDPMEGLGFLQEGG